MTYFEFTDYLMGTNRRDGGELWFEGELPSVQEGRTADPPSRKERDIDSVGIRGGE